MSKRAEAAMVFTGKTARTAPKPCRGLTLVQSAIDTVASADRAVTDAVAILDHALAPSPDVVPAITHLTAAHTSLIGAHRRLICADAADLADMVLPLIGDVRERARLVEHGPLDGPE